MLKDCLGISVGDTVRVCCPDRSAFDQEIPYEYQIVGIVKSVFNAFDADGDNWQIEISNHKQWFMYKPRLDGGEITLLKKGK